MNVCRIVLVCRIFVATSVWRAGLCLEPLSLDVPQARPIHQTFAPNVLPTTIFRILFPPPGRFFPGPFSGHSISTILHAHAFASLVCLCTFACMPRSRVSCLPCMCPFLRPSPVYLVTRPFIERLSAYAALWYACFCCPACRSYSYSILFAFFLQQFWRIPRTLFKLFCTFPAK